MNRAVLIWTSIVGSLFFVLSLKFLAVFNFIDWNPIGWSRRFEVLAGTAGLLKWIILFIITLILSMAIYFFAKIGKRITPGIKALITGIIIALLIEWLIQGPDDLDRYLRDISIPFVVLMLITIRFIVEASVFQSTKPFADPK